MRLIDVNGVELLVRCTLKSTGNKLRGNFQSWFAPLRDGCGCGSGGPRNAQSGIMSGTVDQKTGRVTLDYAVPVGDQEVRIRYEARLADADPHALAV